MSNLEICDAIRDNKVAKIKQLLDDGLDANTIIQCYVAAKGKDPKTVYFTPLCFAVISKRMRIVDLLIQRGANVNHRLSASGDTVLHLAARQSRVSIIFALLSAGADPMATNDNNKNAMEVAQSRKIRDMMRGGGYATKGARP